MTMGSTGRNEAGRIAAIAAAVQAYLSSEAFDKEVQSGRISAWRWSVFDSADSPFASRSRSWTGRD